MVNPGRRGFTLAEVLLSSLMLALVVAAVGQAVAAAQMQSYATLHHQRAAGLLESIIEEIVSRPYYDPDGDTTFGPELDEFTRTDFDAIDDYDGLSEAAGSVEDAVGGLLPAPHQQFGRIVSVASATVTVGGFTDPIPGLAITATVTDLQGVSWSIMRFVMEPQP